MQLRLINDPPAEGQWNMAVDEAMLEMVAAGAAPVLRFYAWREPTLSLGYFQTVDDRRQHVASAACPVVRRSTGGGAIVHDREITYSICLPVRDRWSEEATQLYDLLHGSLVATLAQLGVTAELCLETLVDLQPKFLCFQRRAKGDVLVGAHKVAGSAQRRRHGALLQHGSAILETSAAAPEILGISQIVGHSIDPAAIRELWQGELCNRWPDVECQPSQWTDDERAATSQVVESRRQKLERRKRN
jgi:lipoate-protein ligase A